MSKRVTKLSIVFGLVLGVVVAGLLLFRETGNIEFVIVPGDATLAVDNEKVRGKTGTFAEGEHTISVSRRGFRAKTTTFKATKDKQVIEIALDTSTQEGVDWLIDHPEEAYLRESILGKESNALGEESARKNPIMDLLPFIDREWRVDYGRSVKYPEDPLRISVVITYTTDQAKQDALDWIQFKGFNLADLEIVYN